MRKNSICLVALFLGACGTIFSGTSQDFSFDSKYKDVKIYVDGKKECLELPCEFTVDRSFDDVTFKAKREGYKTQKIISKSSFNMVSLANFLLWPGFIIDVATGAMWKYKIRDYEIEFEPEDKE